LGPEQELLYKENMLPYKYWYDTAHEKSCSGPKFELEQEFVAHNYAKQLTDAPNLLDGFAGLQRIVGVMWYNRTNYYWNDEKKDAL
jgi:hypothetical protein